MVKGSRIEKKTLSFRFQFREREEPTKMTKTSSLRDFSDVIDV